MILFYYLIGVIIITSIFKLENKIVQVKHIPPLLAVSLLWPAVFLIWVLYTIDNRWGDKKIL